LDANRACAGPMTKIARAVTSDNLRNMWKALVVGMRDEPKRIVANAPICSEENLKLSV
jgi:hypothetical protein